MNHWTQGSIGDFAYSISLDFFTQLEDRIQESELRRKEIADKLGVTPSAVTQILNSPPENPALETLVKYARGVGLKVSVVLYNDGDPNNERGPVYSGIFEKSWEALNHPRDLEAVNDAMSSTLLPRFDWESIPHRAGPVVGNWIDQQVPITTAAGHRGKSGAEIKVNYSEGKSSTIDFPIYGTPVLTQRAEIPQNRLQKVERIA